MGGRLDIRLELRDFGCEVLALLLQRLCLLEILRIENTNLVLGIKAHLDVLHAGSRIRGQARLSLNQYGKLFVFSIYYFVPRRWGIFCYLQYSSVSQSS